MYPGGGELHITVAENADFRAALTFRDPDGIPVPFAGGSFLAQVRPVDGSATLLGSGEITVIDADGGQIELYFDGSDFDGLASGNGGRYDGTYDLIFTDGAGIQTQLLQGEFTIFAGVSKP